MGQQHLIHIQSVSKYYQTGDITVKALNGVDLAIQHAEFTAIAGPSGSGKTTLFNIIGGIDTPTEGEIIFDNDSLGSLSKRELAYKRRDSIGFIFQSFNLIPVLTALENVMFPLSLLGIEKTQAKQKTLDVLDQVGLAEMTNRFPRELSGGQQQRVAIARALVKEPLLVLADEPTANLDSETGASILGLMKSLNDTLGVTILFSTHDPSVMEAATRLIRLKDGKVIEDTSQ